MEVEPLLAVDRREAAALPASDPELVERLRAEIENTGPITFARFMAVALADPERGYYATTDDRPTRGGDFLTAPELHPIFGATLGRAVEHHWRALGTPDPFDLVEFGAGTGRMALDILRGLRDRSSDLLDAVRYRPIELVPRRVTAIDERLAAEGFARQLASASTAEAPDRQRSAAGMALANEFLDALPVHRVEQTVEGLTELYVGWADETAGFVEVAGPPSSPDLAARLADEDVTLEDGQRAEICLEIDRWAGELTASIDRGLALVIDYGDDASSLYAPTRRRGTLLAYAGHRAHEDLLTAVGRQDLTAHVDFSAVTSSSERRGWRRLGLASQSSLLVRAGLQDELEARRGHPTTSLEEYLALRSAVGRLLDPRALGGFGVLGLTRGVWDEESASQVAAWWAAAAPAR